MVNRCCPGRFVFLCGAHIDQVIRLLDEPVMGSSNPASVETSPGGAALNTASIASALGLPGSLVSPIGDDANGRLLKSVCKARGIEDGLVTSPGATGMYSGIFDPHGSNVIGAADLTIYEKIDQEWLEQYVLKHADGNDGLFVTSNLVTSILEIVCEAFDFVVGATISPAKAKRLSPILNKLDMLFTNRREACALLDLPEETPGNVLASCLQEAGIRSGTISDAENPLWAWDDKEFFNLSPENSGPVVDVNGAGDALAGACLAALSRGQSMENAIRYAMRVSALIITVKGPYPADGNKKLKAIPIVEQA